MDLRDDVVGEPGHRTELHPVRLLVQAHPEPEVVRRDGEGALGGDDVGGDEQQPARGALGPRERLELAEDLAGQERQDTAELHRGDS